MKLVVTLLFLFDLVALNFASIEQHHIATTNGNLQQDLADFIKLVSADDVRNLTKYFYANDESMRNAYEYLRHDGYKFALHRLREVPMVKMFVVKFNESGVRLTDMEERLKKLLLSQEEAKSIVVQDGGNDMGGMNAFVKEAITMIPQDEVMVLLFRKLEESNAFSSLLEKLNEEDFEKLCENFQRSENVQAIYFEFYVNGIDILEIGKALKKHFWG